MIRDLDLVGAIDGDDFTSVDKSILPHHFGLNR